MITRSFSHYTNRVRSSIGCPRGSLSPPHLSFVSRRRETNIAPQPASAFACFKVVTEAAIAVQGLNTDRMMVAAADRGLTAGIQRP
jgi:hypothetical protein